MSSRDKLVGVDLKREGLLTFHARPDNPSWSFAGAPICDGRHVWVAMRRSDVTPHVFVACFNAASGAQLWRTSIGSADTPGSARGSESPQNVLTLVGDRIFFNTNVGLVAALHADDGQIRWLHRYDRLSGEWFAKNPGGPTCLDRNPSPCVYHDGLLIVAPSDTADIFALDTHTGQRVWTSHQFPDALHLLGVVQSNLVISGNRVGALDVRSGSVRYVWPESEHAGIRGMGRGLVAGSEIFWPTRTEIYVLHALSGEQTRSPISLGAFSDGGANLAAGHGRLIAASPEKLMAFGPNASPKPNAPTKTETALRTERVSGRFDTAR
jgi:outer membrane protein assembly factor BamB